MNQAQAISATLVPDAQRLDALPRAFGSRYMLPVEAGVFNWMRRYVPFYTGGDYHFYTLSNGGFFMALKTNGLMRVHTPNGFDHMVSAETAGVIAMIYVLNGLMWRAPEAQVLADRYQQLREYAKGLPDCSLIFAAID